MKFTWNDFEQFIDYAGNFHQTILKMTSLVKFSDFIA